MIDKARVLRRPSGLFLCLKTGKTETLLVEVWKYFGNKLEIKGEKKDLGTNLSLCIHL